MKSAALQVISLKPWLLLATLGISGLQFADADSDPKRFELIIQDRHLAGGNDMVRVEEGDTVELVWTGDEAGRLHLHGYDIEFNITPGEPTVVRFEAYATGRFPVTSHGFGDEHGHGHQTLLYVEVHPD